MTCYYWANSNEPECRIDPNRVHARVDGELAWLAGDQGLSAGCPPKLACKAPTLVAARHKQVKQVSTVSKCDEAGEFGADLCQEERVSFRLKVSAL
jgi:hypothetical protein